MYDGDLDATGHRRGCGSWAWRHQLTLVDAFALGCCDGAARRTRAWSSPATTAWSTSTSTVGIDVDEEPELMRGVTLFGGEARFRHLYCDAAPSTTCSPRWRERLGDGRPSC